MAPSDRARIVRAVRNDAWRALHGAAEYDERELKRLRAFAAWLGDDYSVELLSQAIFRLIRGKLEVTT